jgi:putative Holliday junction resolvase
VNDEQGRVLGIDLGDARIGLALSDPLRVTAQPLGSIRCRGAKVDVDEIARRAREHDVRTIVVGLPRLMSGAEGTRAADARTFAAGLARRLEGVEIELWDERLTTAEAERTMISANVRRDKRRRAVDAMAAALILQGWLDAHSGTAP